MCFIQPKMSEINKFAIIVAGGSGSRMQTDIPKQFLRLAGKPILLRTLEQFLLIRDCEIILVLPKAEQAYWLRELEQNFATSTAFKNERIKLADGGSTRFQSVKNGLAKLHATRGVVAVHDGVRPIISPETIENSFAAAATHKAVVCSVALKDSIREVDVLGENKAVDRTLYRLMQTPQTFDIQLFKLAYEQAESPLFTDDASVVEAYGSRIKLIEGDYKNIKITTPEDIAVAEAFLTISEQAK